MTEIKQVQAEWEKYLRNRRKDSRGRMIQALQTVFDHFKSYRKVSEFYRDECQEYLRHRFEEDGVAAATVNTEMYTACSFWYWLMERGLAEWNPWARIPKIPERRRRKGLPRPEDCPVMQARGPWHQRVKRLRGLEYKAESHKSEAASPAPSSAPSCEHSSSNALSAATTKLSP